MNHTPVLYVAPCGCKAFTRKYKNGEHGAIDYCPPHKAGPALLKAAKAAVAALTQTRAHEVLADIEAAKRWLTPAIALAKPKG